MKNLIYSLVTLLALSACNSGGGGGPATPAKPLGEQLAEAKSATDFSSNIAAEKFTVIKATLSYEEQKEKYGVGCKTPGEPSWQFGQIDPALRVGHVFVVKQGRSELLDSDTFDTQEKTIAAIEGNRLVTDINFLEGSLGDSLFSSVDQIFYGKPNLTLTTIYSTAADGTPRLETDFKGKYTPAALEYLQNRVGVDTYLSCSVSYEVGSYSHTVDKVSYQLNGRNVLAFVDKISNSGEVTCTRRTSGSDKEGEKVNLGRGTSQRITISSNDIVSESTLSCGGVDVYSMEKIILDTGKVVKSDVTKMVSAPAR